MGLGNEEGDGLVELYGAPIYGTFTAIWIRLERWLRIRCRNTVFFFLLPWSSSLLHGVSMSITDRVLLAWMNFWDWEVQISSSNSSSNQWEESFLNFPPSGFKRWESRVVTIRIMWVYTCKKTTKFVARCFDLYRFCGWQGIWRRRECRPTQERSEYCRF